MINVNWKKMLLQTGMVVNAGFATQSKRTIETEWLQVCIVF